MGSSSALKRTRHLWEPFCITCIISKYIRLCTFTLTAQFCVHALSMRAIQTIQMEDQLRHLSCSQLQDPGCVCCSATQGSMSAIWHLSHDLIIQSRGGAAPAPPPKYILVCIMIQIMPVIVEQQSLHLLMRSSVLFGSIFNFASRDVVLLCLTSSVCSPLQRSTGFKVEVNSITS